MPPTNFGLCLICMLLGENSLYVQLSFFGFILFVVVVVVSFLFLLTMHSTLVVVVQFILFLACQRVYSKARQLSIALLQQIAFSTTFYYLWMFSNTLIHNLIAVKMLAVWWIPLHHQGRNQDLMDVHHYCTTLISWIW